MELCNYHRIMTYQLETYRKWLDNGGRKLKSEYSYAYVRSPKGRYVKYKTDSKRRGLSFELTIEEFVKLISSPCVYCGESDKKIGIDRVDNTLPYTTNNSVPCCMVCNYMKKDMSKDMFLNHVRKILGYVISKI